MEMATTVPLMRASGVHALVRWLNEQGRNTRLFLQEAGLDLYDLSNPDAVIPLLPASAFCNAVMKAEGPDIGVRIVSPATLQQIGGAGRMLLAGPSIRSSLLKLAMAFSRQATHAHLVVTPENGSVIVRHYYSIALPPEFLHFSQQFNIALLFSLARAARSDEPLMGRIEMQPHPSCGLDHLKRYFGPELFASAAPGLAVWVPRHVVDRRIGNAAEEDDATWPSLRGPGTFGYSVRLLLREMLHLGEPAVGEVAAISGLSVRTLQRQLANEGETFAQVLDDVRRQIVLGLLKSGKAGVTAAGLAAGYSSQAAVTRAVRRWSGTTPRDLLRKQGDSPRPRKG